MAYGIVGRVGDHVGQVGHVGCVDRRSSGRGRLRRRAFLAFVLSACVNDVGGDGVAGAAPHVVRDIVGGRATAIEQRPWQVSLQTVDGVHFCGGAIVDTEWVVTAQHCVDAVSSDALLRVVAGITKLSQVSAAQAQPRSIERVARHPGYVAPEHGKDIALLHLAAPLDLSEPEARAIRLASAADAAAGSTDAGAVGTVSGWGALGNGARPDALRSVSLPLLSNTTAQRAYAGETITADQLAAGAAGRDSCQGDSGGPLTVLDGAGLPILAGVVSWGYGCGDERFPGLYARVSSFHSWIAGHVGDAALAGDAAVPAEVPPAAPLTLLDEPGLAGGADSEQRFSVTVPAGALALEVALAGGVGDADLYVRFAAPPTTSTHDCAPFLGGNDEACAIAEPAAGTWHVLVHGYTSFSGARLTATATLPDGPVTLSFDDFATWGAWEHSGDAALSLGAARLRRASGDIRKTIATNGATSLALSFTARVSAFEPDDAAFVKVSGDGGAHYTTLRTFTAADDDGAFGAWTIELGALDGAAAIVVRFDADMNAATDGWYVDDVVVTGRP